EPFDVVLLEVRVPPDDSAALGAATRPALAWRRIRLMRYHLAVARKQKLTVLDAPRRVSAADGRVVGSTRLGSLVSGGEQALITTRASTLIVGRPVAEAAGAVVIGHGWMRVGARTSPRQLVERHGGAVLVRRRRGVLEAAKPVVRSRAAARPQADGER